VIRRRFQSSALAGLDILNDKDFLLYYDRFLTGNSITSSDIARVLIADIWAEKIFCDNRLLLLIRSTCKRGRCRRLPLREKRKHGCPIISPRLCPIGPPATICLPPHPFLPHFRALPILTLIGIVRSPLKRLTLLRQSAGSLSSLLLLLTIPTKCP